MDTIQLYYAAEPVKTFTATVLSCRQKKDGYAVILDRTAFYPEGGGQPCDLGTLGGGQVYDVQHTDEGIVHLCQVPMEPGTCVQGEIDWQRRFDLTQQHSGEHLVSGIIHARFGYDNVGFHIGAQAITIDFNGPLQERDLQQVEQLANQAIWENLTTEILYPSAQELAQMQYRSKKALNGQVRIVRFAGVDCCACCGTHVQQTGQIGLIKLLSATKFHEGVRIEMLCGARALRYLNDVVCQNQQISVLLSAKPLQTAQAVQRIYTELNNVKYQCSQMEQTSFNMRASQLQGCGNVVLFEKEMPAESVRKLAAAVMQTCGGRCCVFSGDDTQGYKYAIGQENGDLRQWIKALNTQLCGRGGGKPFFAQGAVQAVRSEIEAFLTQNGGTGAVQSF